MKFGLIHYNAPGETVEEFLDYAKDAGFDGVELQIRDVWPDESEQNPEQEAKRVRKLLDDRNLLCGALSGGNDFLYADPAAVSAQAVRLRRVMKVAKLLGTNVIRVDGGWPREGKVMPPEERWADAIADGLSQCVADLETEQVYLGLDNHGTVTNNAEFQLMILGMVGSRWVGTTMDTMNYRWMGHDIATCNRYYELSARRAVHVHLKDGTGCRGEYKGCALGQGEIDLAHAVRELKKRNYQGLWCAEYEGKDADGYTQCLAWMKANIPNL